MIHMYQKNNKPIAKTIVTESITTALLQLMKTKPFSKIQIQEIVNKAGVSRVSYYRHFDDKEDILSKYMYIETEGFHNSHYGEEENIYLIHLFEHIKSYHEIFVLLYENNLSYIFSEHIYRWLGPDENEKDDTVAYFKSAYAYAVFGYIDEWIKRGMNGEPKELGAQLVSYLQERNINFKR